ESDRIHRLIEDLLYLSSIEHHQMPLRIENVNLTASVEEIVETLKEKLKKKKLTLVFRKPKDVWLEGERDRIQQVIVNLLSNAISYTPEGGQITVDLEDK